MLEVDKSGNAICTYCENKIAFGSLRIRDENRDSWGHMRSEFSHAECKIRFYKKEIESIIKTIIRHFNSERRKLQ